jgi:GNAT superfamily N-acetyltransferase
MTSISVVDYRPEPALDNDLADLAYAAVHGWPDQAALTPAQIRSWLRATGTTATTLALYRDGADRLLAAAALRWPATLEEPGWLWGPMVHPSVQRGGLGTLLLGALSDVVSARPGVRVTSAEIPETRKAGWGLYERAGWHNCGTANLLTRTLPAALALTAPAATVPVRTARAGDYLDPALAELVASARPHLGYATARDTYTRWASDERYDPEGLLLVEGPDRLLGAAVVYPVTHNRYGEPHQAVFGDLVVRGDLDRYTGHVVRSALVAAGLQASVRLGASEARALAYDAAGTDTFVAAGFDVLDQVRYYSTSELSAA